MPTYLATMKILVVDDDQDQRDLRSLLLSLNGFDALPASDKATAKQLATQHRPSAAIVDLSLPTVNDGLELIRELKAIDEQMRVVVLTGSAVNTFYKRPEAGLVDELLTKPTSTKDLIRTLKSYEA